MGSTIGEGTTEHFSKVQTTLLVVLRLIIGWHLLYEGIAKLLIPDWTAAAFLST